MNIFFVFVLILLLNGTFSTSIKPDYPKVDMNPYKLYFINYDYKKLVEFLKEQRAINLKILTEKEKEKHLYKQRESLIYRELLANRVLSSVLRDFHTIRY